MNNTDRYTACRPNDADVDLVDACGGFAELSYVDDGITRTERQWVTAPCASELPAMADDAGAGWIDDLIAECLAEGLR